MRAPRGSDPVVDGVSLFSNRMKRASDPSEQQLCFSLLSWCLQPDADNEAFFLLRDRIQQWDVFIELVRWHRVAALAWQRLSPLSEQLPPAVAESVQQMARNTAMQSLKLTHELKRVSALLQLHQIEFVVLKGPPLAQQLYGNPGLRFSKDIDILVQEKDVERANTLLSGHSYLRVFPPLDFPEVAMSRYKEFSKDYVYRHRDSGSELELHWRFNNNPHLLELDVFEPFRHITSCKLAGMELPVLSSTHQALYLMTHAARSSWGRLSWLTDIAALLRAPLDWESLLELARINGLTNIVWITANLTHHLLKIPLPEPLQAERFSAGPGARLLLRYFLTSTPQARYPGIIIRTLLDFLLCQRPGYKRSHLLQGFALHILDIAALPLPARFHFFYYPLRPFIYTWRKIRDHHQKKKALS